VSDDDNRMVLDHNEDDTAAEEDLQNLKKQKK
jgi:hypothetical protein